MLHTYQFHQARFKIDTTGGAPSDRSVLDNQNYKLHTMIDVGNRARELTSVHMRFLMSGQIPPRKSNRFESQNGSNTSILDTTTS